MEVVFQEMADSVVDDHHETTHEQHSLQMHLLGGLSPEYTRVLSLLALYTNIRSENGTAVSLLWYIYSIL